MSLTLLDCTLRDGGYYNNWDFPRDLIVDYLEAMDASGVDYVELGFRFLGTNGFKGVCAYTRDSFIRRLPVPEGLKIGVMMNASELHRDDMTPVEVAQSIFAPASESPVTLVRLACHVHQFEASLPVSTWLKEQGYEVGFNLMQIADRTTEEIESLAESASQYPLDVLYFADSMGGLSPDQTAEIVRALRKHWDGPLGIHTHDNMGRAVANTARAVQEGVTWVDGTVTGMGRGPGNARTEYLVLELEDQLDRPSNHTALLEVIRKHFGPMMQEYGWGPNPYYYLAGKHGIHPTFVQQMLGDPRYEESETLAVIEHLREVGGKKFNVDTLESGRRMYSGPHHGTWSPKEMMEGREVLILGGGPSAKAHREGIEHFIRDRQPVVIALNTHRALDESLVDLRAACHPFRMVADSGTYASLPQPLAVPLSQLPDNLRDEFEGVEVLDYGLVVTPGSFEFSETGTVAPYALVVAYAMGIATSGGAERIYLAGFDGFPSDDPRTAEMNEIFSLYNANEKSLPVQSITPTRYRVPTTSLYALESA